MSDVISGKTATQSIRRCETAANIAPYRVYLRSVASTPFEQVNYENHRMFFYIELRCVIMRIILYAAVSPQVLNNTGVIKLKTN